MAAEALAVEDACRSAGATGVFRAASGAEREALWRIRRELSPALKTNSPIKLNNDVIVPEGVSRSCST